MMHVRCGEICRCAARLSLSISHTWPFDELTHAAACGKYHSCRNTRWSAAREGFTMDMNCVQPGTAGLSIARTTLMRGVVGFVALLAPGLAIAPFAPFASA